MKQLLEIIKARKQKLQSLNKQNLKEKVVVSETIFIDLENNYKNKHSYVEKIIDSSKGLINFKINLKSRFKDVNQEGFPIVNFAIPIVEPKESKVEGLKYSCLLYTSPSPRDQRGSRMPSSA